MKTTLLTIAGASALLLVSCENPADKSTAAINLKADFFINRFDFDVKYPGKQDDLIREEVVIRFDLNAKPATTEG